jgi:hypothetical protein
MKHIKSFLSLYFSISSLLILANPGDTLGISAGSVPKFSPNGNTTIVKDPEGGYTFGTGVRAPFQSNGAPIGVVTGVAQGYENNQSVRVAKVLALIPKKVKSANSAGAKLTFKIHPISPTGGVNGPTQEIAPGPGTVLSSTDLLFDDINTSGGYSVASFSSPVTVNTDLVISCDFSDFILKTDSVCFASDGAGNGLGLKYTWRMVSITNLWDKWFTAETWSLNLNIAIFAVLEESVGVEQLDQSAIINGTRAIIFPNPVNKSASFEFEISERGNYSLDIIDASGKIVQTTNLGNRTNGKHTVQLTTDQLSSGQYYYSLSDEQGNRYTKSFVVSGN